ncbi:hypothetical protein AAFF_G00201870 [Aldrovandia affinis]|uniref:Uncharacterized protein n=1 Tax=Aldrovandia affinis TaxID=143900 RepID=A0AAD7SWV6_9TELE|nr:hypothetical protein AAFF_G00201870 [Aldrovandia affinis]
MAERGKQRVGAWVTSPFITLLHARPPPPHCWTALFSPLKGCHALGGSFPDMHPPLAGSLGLVAETKVLSDGREDNPQRNPRRAPVPTLPARGGPALRKQPGRGLINGASAGEPREPPVSRRLSISSRSVNGNASRGRCRKAARNVQRYRLTHPL